MNLAWIISFNTIIEEGSLTKAAHTLHLTQPAVSKHLRSLEEHYGTTLIYRTARDVELTEAGKLVYQYTRRLAEMINESQKAVFNLAGVMKGELLLGASTIPGECILPAILGRFQQFYPDVRVKMVIADSELISRKVLENSIEVGFVGAPVKNKALQQELVYGDELVVIFSQNHKFIGRDEITLDEFLLEPLILRERGSGTRKVIEERFSRQGVDLRKLQTSLELGSLQAVIKAVASGLGVSLVSLLAAQPLADSGTIAYSRIKDFSLKRGLYCLTKKNSLSNPILTNFLAFLRKEQKIKQ